MMLAFACRVFPTLVDRLLRWVLSTLAESVSL